MKGTRKMDNKTNKHEFACNAGKVTEYEVKEHIDTIMVGFRGFSKEVSIVKWNDKKPVFDIRAWRVSDETDCNILCVVSLSLRKSLSS